MTITEAQKRQYEEQGFFILEAVIPGEHLELLRGECQRLMDFLDAEMDERETDHLGLSFRGSRYFLSAWHKSQKVREFIFSPLMADVCRATVGDTAVLAFEQFVVKAAEKGMKFSWHQDSGYVQTPHKPYVTCWCTLDDVTEENGTVYVLPYDRAGTRARVEHVKDEKTNDLVGYFGDDPGIPIIAPAGSIAVFSSTVFHRSGPNTTNGIRRIFLPQYSAAPVLGKDGKPQYLAEPFLKDGTVVFFEEAFRQ